MAGSHSIQQPLLTDPWTDQQNCNMLFSTIHAFALTSSIALSQVDAWGGGNESEESKWDPEQSGQVPFVSSSGTLESDPSLTFDRDEKVIKMDKFAANTFWGDSINFRGREIRNAALTNPSIEGLDHLTVDSIALRSQSSPGKNGFGIAMIDSGGALSASQHVRWDEKIKELKVSSLNAFSKSGLEIRSDVDFMSHELKNAKIQANTTLEQLVFKDGYIENSVLHNVTATGLGLGEVKMDSLSISKFDAVSAIGSFLVVGNDGAIELSPDLKRNKEGRLLIDNEVVLAKTIDLNLQDVLNANIKSGRIDGNIDVSVNDIDGKTLSLRGIRDDKTIISDGLALLGLDGKFKMSPISIDNNGVLGDMKVHGTIDFQGSSSDSDLESHGTIKGARISGGIIDGIGKLDVLGETELGSGLQVSGDTYLGGALTVSGSVLGSGPYIDVSDKRFKRNVENIESTDALRNILQLKGVSYELDIPNQHRLGKGKVESKHTNRRQLGFLAQDVEKLFPEVVYTDENDFKGLQYSRFVPILVEGFKELHEFNLRLAEEHENMKRTIDSLIKKVDAIRSREFHGFYGVF